MMQWMSDHAQFLNTLVGIATLLVWIFYATLLMAGFKRQRYPQLLITRGWGNGIDAPCLISNMSQEAIYIVNILVSLYTQDGVKHRIAIPQLQTSPATDHLGSESSASVTQPSPLEAAEQLNIGSFRSLAQSAAEVSGMGKVLEETSKVIRLTDLTIDVIGIYGPVSGFVGAQRKFQISSNRDVPALQPYEADTRQLASWMWRRHLRTWARRHL